MSAEMIRFLQLRRRGLDLQKLVQDASEKRDEAQDAQCRREAEELISRQGAVEAKVNSLVTRIAALDVVDPGRGEAEALRKRLQVMRSVQEELQEVLTKKQTELQTRQRDMAGLIQGLGALGHLLRQAPPPYEDKLLEFGASITKHIGEK